ncbi:MAG: hypothetical protein HQK50_06145 [Oligoflexia bacterium]|nr:hypothetical protein [Oligoflexia bacterium]MBF0365132.1 hypothetical protein [Oligoflexia bacterium]
MEKMLSHLSLLQGQLQQYVLNSYSKLRRPTISDLKYCYKEYPFLSKIFIFVLFWIFSIFTANAIFL